MTIRRQIFLFVTLLFAGVGALGGAVSWWLQTSALQRAFETQGRAVAVAVAEFVGPREISQLRRGADWRDTALGTAWQRWQRWRTTLRLFVIDAKTGLPLADSARGAPLPGAAERVGWAAGEVRLLPIRRDAGGSYRLPLLLPAAGPGALVGLEIAADDYIAERRAILSRAEAHLAWGTLIGVVLGAVLGGIVSRAVGRLATAVDAVGSPAFAIPGQDSPMREVVDLGAALGVMHSVLGATLDQARRALVESDHFRTEAGLAHLWRRALQGPEARQVGGAEAAWFSVGSPPPSAFVGTVALGADAGAAFVGLGKGGEGVDAAARARAVGAYLENRLATRTLAAAAEETCGLFGISRLVVVRWEAGRFECWETGGDSGIDRAGWGSGQPILLSGLGPENLNRSRLYVAAFAGHAVRDALRELPPLLDAREPGIALILRKLSRRNPAQSNVR